MLGPGSYDIEHWKDRAVKPITIPRAKKQGNWQTGFKKNKIKNKGSIKADFEESDTETDTDGDKLGPGSYLQEFHTSTFGNEAILHDHP